MGLKRLVLKNTAFQTAAQVVSIVLGMAVNMLLSRYLGVEGFGRYNYVFAFYFFFLALNDFGTGTIVIREISKNRESAGEIIGAMVGMKLLVSTISILIAWGVISYMDRPPELKMGLLLYAFMMPVLALQLPSLVFQVDLKMEYPSILGICSRLLQFFLLLVAVWKRASLPWLIIALVSTDAFFIPIYWFYARKFVRFSLSLNFKIGKAVLLSSIPLGISGLLGGFTNQANFILLEKIGSLKEVGLYSASFRIIMLLLLLPNMIMITLYPIMSRYADQNADKLRTLYRHSQIYFVLGGLFLGLGITAAAPLIIKIIFGGKFIEAAAGLRILIWSVVLLYGSIGSGNLLISIGKEWVGLFALSISGGVSFLLNLLLIPSQGHLGAAWASVGSTAVLCSISLIMAEYYLSKIEQTMGPPKPQCIFLTRVGGRTDNFKHSLIRRGWGVEEFKCFDWPSVFLQMPDFFVALGRSRFVFADMNFPWQSFWLLWARALGQKVVLDCPVDVTVKPFADSPRWKSLIRFFARRADFFLTLESRRYLVEKFDLSPKKVLFIENCPDLKRIEYSKMSAPVFTFPPNSVRLCYSGVAPWHGIERFVKIFKALRHHLPNVYWLVIGHLEEPSIRQLQEKIRGEGLSAAVYFHPVIKPFESFLATVNQCDLWLSHFDDETLLGRNELRTEILEIGLLEKAVAAVKTPSTEMHGFCDEENILFVDPFNPEKSALKLAKYLNSKESLERLGIRLKKHILQRFSLEESMDRLLAALEKGIDHEA